MWPSAFAAGLALVGNKKGAHKKVAELRAAAGVVVGVWFDRTRFR